MSFIVELDINEDPAKSTIKAVGSLSHIITDEERKTFRIEDSALKQAVAAYFGKIPNDAFVRSPTPWNDLYKTYNWEQVQLHLRVKEAKITGVSSRPTILLTQIFNNNSSKPATFDVSISQDVSDSCEANWSTTIGISVTQSVYYGTRFFGGETSLTFSAEFQRGGSTQRMVTVGQTSGVMVDLEPGEAVRAKLSADYGTVQARITWEAFLSGISAVNYNPKYRDHHFWSLAIDGVRQSVNLPGRLEVVEDIEVGFYSNGEITLEDVDTEKRIAALTTAMLRRP